MLPGIDDGAQDLDTALEMARLAVADGIRLTACTPHIYPSLYENRADDIQAAVERFRGHLQAAGIPLEVTYGADIQLVPELVEELDRRSFPTLHGSRYFLFEPPHHVAPPHFSEVLFDVLSSGYIPIITHPERLTWLDDEHYDWFTTAARRGAWLQLTAGSVVGRFGRGPRYWAERMLDDGVVHILATDAHDTGRRPPCLAEGREAAAAWVGADEAERMVVGRPQLVVDDRPADGLPLPPGLTGRARPATAGRPASGGWLKRLFGAHG
jgi:protein-tyrosine phosphatase